MVSYGYDGAHRLTSESRTGTNAYTRTYVLDGVGNRTSQTVGGVTTNFTINNDDELTASSGGFVNSYGYNANGEQTSRTLSGTAYTLGYDFEGQLTSISGGATASFAYDALGRRHSRTAGGVTTRFIRGPGGILLEKQGSTYTRTFTHGNGQVRMNSEYPMYDGVGSERTVTAANQSVSGTITFEGFGQPIATTGSSGNPYMFKGAWGYRNDGDAGLHHVGARYYDAQVGRFITRDTELDQHPYLYCDHDPINFADPAGNLPEWIERLGRFAERMVDKVVGWIERSPGRPAGAYIKGITTWGPFWIGSLLAALKFRKWFDSRYQKTCTPTGGSYYSGGARGQTLSIKQWQDPDGHIGE